MSYILECPVSSWLSSGYMKEYYRGALFLFKFLKNSYPRTFVSLFLEREEGGRGWGRETERDTHTHTH